MRTALLAVLLLLGPAPGASAGILLVNPDGSGDFPTIQAALATAVTGDVIELGNGVFTGAGNRDLDFMHKPLTLRSRGGEPTACTIDPQGSGGTSHRAIDLESIPAPGAVIAGITFADGYDVGAGSGVLAWASPVALRHCVFRGNRGAYFAGGAGLAVFNGTATLDSCRFEDNATTHDIPIAGRGGALYGQNATITLTGCDFVGNGATSTFDSGAAGGAVACVTSQLTAAGCTFLGNTVSPAIMSSCRGGALSLAGGVAALTGCVFADNVATWGEGGAVALDDGGALTLTNCTLFRNAAMTGAVALFTGTAELVRTIIAYSAGTAVSIVGGSATLTNCDLFGHAGGNWVGAIADQRFVRGNFAFTPCFCDTAAGDLHLCAESMAAPANNPGGQPVLVGALDVGCSGCNCPVPVDGVGGGDVADSGPDRGPALLGATPNPFNPRTEIGFVLARAGRVAVRVYDARGALVRTVADGDRPAGRSVAAWDGRDESGGEVSSGVYFCRVTADGGGRTVKLMLVR